MLNTALQVLSKDGSIADNTYQVIGEDGGLPQGDVVLTVEQLDLKGTHAFQEKHRL